MVSKRIWRLVRAIEGTSVAPTSLVEQLSRLEAERREVATTLANLQPVPRLAPEVVEDRLAEWRRLICGSVTDARAVLQRMLIGRITLTRVEGGYTFEAPTRCDRLFAGVAMPKPVFLASTGRGLGTEHMTAADTMDADYAAVLERALNQLAWRPQRDAAMSCAR